jgi:antitoxin (DNA-binding transcriptional repressor) of toxin-antitoxin stability system
MEKNYPEISVSEFKATCLKVLDTICKTGDSLLITKRGEPLALVTPPPQKKKKKSWLGMCEGQGVITGDIMSPALDPDDWGGLS